MTQLQQLRSTVANRKKKSSHRHLGKSNSLLSSNGFTSQGTNKRESSLLGDLHVDKLYLENLLLNPGIGEENPSAFLTFPYLIQSSR